MSIFFKKLPLIVCCIWAGLPAAADTSISGIVHNESTGQPSAGDEVILVRLGQGMQEEGRTKTDAQGAFTLNVAQIQSPHLIQVLHQRVSYDQPVTGPGPFNIVVYNAVANVPGLQGRIGVAEIQSDGKVIQVTEKYEILNGSNPPVTQYRPDNFEITVPSNAVFDSVQARRGVGMWLKLAPVSVNGKSGKYSLDFPIRPGANQFAYTYHVPYQAPFTFHMRVPYPTLQFGVMHPPSMKFKALHAGFEPAKSVPGMNFTAELAEAKPTKDEVPAFQISGIGTALEHGTQAQAAAPQQAQPPQPGQQGQAPVVAARPPSPASPAHAPVAAQSVGEQSHGETWLMVGGIVVVLGIMAFTVWRMKAAPQLRPAGSAADAPKPLVEALKEELFQLESERLHGSISDEEYASTKDALNDSIRRAMARNSS